MFIDRTVVEVRSGNGGNGAIAFLHEKFIAKGGPSGGNGGRGGSVIFKASSKITTLINYRFSKVIAAKDGENGATKNRYGHKAEDVYAEVPVGTVLINEETNEVIEDLDADGKEFIIAKGGRGGRGNACFKSSVNRVPRVAENGVPGETKRIVLELKLLADVGIVGYPSVGKSTFLGLVTKANPIVADYDFTTIVPNLGVTNLKDGRSFVIADLPGLIDGAHLGKGLGITFLRHIERCKILMHIVSMDGKRDPFEAYNAIKKELLEYGYGLEKKAEIVVASKMDEDGAIERFEKFKSQMNREIIPISAYTNENIDKVLYVLADKLDEVREQDILNATNVKEVPESKVYDAKKDEKPLFEIRRIKTDTYEIYGESIERTYKLINITTDEGMMKLISYLRKIGIDQKLKEMDAKDGDTVILCDFEFEYIE
ncbi:MAG: GTPase ObgE [Bacilli bacterium]